MAVCPDGSGDGADPSACRPSRGSAATLSGVPRLCLVVLDLVGFVDTLSLLELVEALRRRGVQLPMIVRFPDIVQHRIGQLQRCFDSAIRSYGYESHFQGVFPVKSNHDRYLVEDIVEYGRQFRFGLEAGSKPEILIAIANLLDSPDALLICNGYKDRVYIESVLLARQLGINGVLVLEQMKELDLVLDVARRLGIRPVVGLRAKLSTRHNGHWGDTSGDQGKFGLTVTEIVQVVYALREAGMLDCLQLLHFHIGSQIPSIAIIKEAMREASNLYCELVLMGAQMGYCDVGGGLGVDYDGTKSRSGASTNYTMQNYANDVVAAVLDACTVKGVRQPVILSESGRALASHHSVLVFDVLGVTQNSEERALENLNIMSPPGKVLVDSAVGNGQAAGQVSLKTGGSTNGHASHLTAGEYLLHTFEEVHNSMKPGNFQEAFNDAKQFRAEAAQLFRELPEELAALRKSMAAVYHINLSVFRSVPDAWAIDQVFPIVPLQRLHEEPLVHATLADLTCDSDGRIHRFIGHGPPSASSPMSCGSDTLRLHQLLPAKPYYLGLFLGGVYQARHETMGGLHNLFGSTNVVHVRSRPKGSVANGGSGHRYKSRFIIEHMVKGQNMEEVLCTAHHKGGDMMERLRQAAETAVTVDQLPLDAAQNLLANFQECLRSYTYFDN
eukprot:SM000032S12131  [mRNA]  locus=s32:612951:616829:- [translate_table: standard]